MIGDDGDFVVFLEEGFFADFGVAGGADGDEGGFWIVGKFDEGGEVFEWAFVFLGVELVFDPVEEFFAEVAVVF